jgi:hypothetical protein
LVFFIGQELLPDVVIAFHSLETARQTLTMKGIGAPLAFWKKIAVL